MAEREVRLEKADLVVLENRWQDACSILRLKDVSKPGQSSVFEKVMKAYFERAGFHNLDHLRFMFALLDQYRDKLRKPEVVDLAVFFHDFRYLVPSSTNEKDSAALARAYLFPMGAGKILVENVSDMVLATEEHKVVPGARDDLAYFLDSDMAILGADKKSYSKYAAGVALDFKAIGVARYAAGRKNFLTRLVGKRIFSTDEMHTRFHDAAQENIAEEIEQWKKIRASLTAN